MKTFSINGHQLGVDPCYIIAEVGSNHDKDKDRAFEMIRRSAKAGANAVKFQLFKASKIAIDLDLSETRLTDKFSKFGNTVYDLYKDMELPDTWLDELKRCCDEEKVDFLATPFDEKSADQLAKTGVAAMKVASFEITHIPLLRHLARFKLPVLLSTGMANIEEITQAIETLNRGGEDRVALFHCGIDYPQKIESVNLRCMDTLKKEFHCPIGYSDHTRGHVVAVAAVAMGASIYEKHITLDGGKSPDHDFALTMEEFEEMVFSMRECEKALGSSEKKVQPHELTYRLRGRRSIFVVRDIRKGEFFNRDNIAVLRPGVGIAPEQYEKILGLQSNKSIKAPAMLTKEDLDDSWRS